MKRINCFLSIAILSTFLFPSCNIEKRVYMPGYHVDWHDFNTAQGEKQPVTPVVESNSANAQKGFLTEVPATPKQEVPGETTMASAKSVSAFLEHGSVVNFKNTVQKMLPSERFKKFKAERVNLEAKPDNNAKGQSLFPVIGLALSLLSLIFFMTALVFEFSPAGFLFVFLGFVAGLVGALMSGIGLRKSIKDKEKTSQKIISIIGLALGFFGFIFCILLFWYMILTWADEDFE
jgi:hypothetical protein